VTADPNPGDVVGPYRLEAVLGEGAMGIVYRATRDDAVVALKVMRGELSGDELYRRRFAHEVRAATEVTHRHLVPVLEGGEADGRYYLAVAFVPGRTLEERLRGEGPLPLTDLLRVGAQVASGLDALHAAGLIHRDIKSSNVMLDPDHGAMLTDFGMAKGPAYTVLTKPGQMVGTLDYLAPELIKGEPATPATDLYAFGCLLYECLTGEPPFAAERVFQICNAHLEEAPPDPVERRPETPPGLSWALLRGMAKNPAERPPTATAYANMLNVAGRVAPPR